LAAHCSVALALALVLRQVARLALPLTRLRPLRLLKVLLPLPELVRALRLVVGLALRVARRSVVRSVARLVAL
jgi:hypothetical protein